MSFRYLKVDDSIGFVNRVEDFFDPRHNTHYLHDEGNFQWSKMLSILNTFFCKENTDQFEFAKVFLLNGVRMTEEEHEAFCELTQDIPANQRYLIGFLRRDRRFGSDATRCHLMNTFYSVDVGSSYMSYEPGWEVFSGTDRALFTERVNVSHQAFQTSIFSRCASRTRWASSHVTVASPAALVFLRFISGQYISSGNENHNAFSLTENLGQDGFVYTVNINPNDSTVRLKANRTVTRTNRKALHKILTYTTDVLSMLPYPNMEPKEKNPVLVGVELEVSTDYQVNELIDAAEDPFFLAKSDSSISGCKNYRMELVTSPCSFKYLKRQYALWFNKLDYNKFDCTVDTSNGMHVHVGREHFEDNHHIRNFCWFFNNPANTDFLVQISERTRENLMKWSPTYQWHSGSSRTRAFRDINSYVVNMRGITNLKGGWENGKTVEVRMFKGIVSYAAICKNLEFVEAVFHFSKGLTSYRDLTLRGFFKWLDMQSRNRFILLRKFIDQEINIDKMLLHADLKDLIFTETQPVKIAAKLAKAPFKVTNEHITILNRKEKKRVYTLDKETGEIRVTLNNIAKLASFDKSFAERYTRHLPKVA